MTNSDNARQILINRYSKLSNVSIDKTTLMFERTSIEEIIEKHEKKVVFSIVLMILIAFALFVQFIILYLSKSSIPFRLLINILLLIVIQKGLHDNYEIKQILRTLKEIGLH